MKSPISHEEALYRQREAEKTRILQAGNREQQARLAAEEEKARAIRRIANRPAISDNRRALMKPSKPRITTFL